MIKFLKALLAGLLMLTGCDLDNPEPEIVLEFNLEENPEGWTGDFADYPVTDSLFYELEFAHSSLPANIEGSRKGLKLSGNNHSDDLFMFITRKVSGLEPNTSYQIVFRIELASNAPTGAVGIGGAPGESVFLKMGATVIEPAKENNGDGFYLMNIDKGNQANSGADMKTIGHIGVADNTTDFTMITRTNETEPFTVDTDATGSLWLIIGTDSGFEGTTTLYYDDIKVKLTIQ